MVVMSTLEERVARLEDVRAIETLKYRYAEVCDTGYSAEGFGAIFSPDARWSADGFGTFVGRDAICEFFSDLAPSVILAKHYVTSPRITVSEDGLHGTGRFYLLCLSRSRNRRDPKIIDFVITMGVYDDRFRKDAGRWSITDMAVTVQHVSRLPQAGPTSA